jgi:hypothetical protein
VTLANDDSRAVSAAATGALDRIGGRDVVPPAAAPAAPPPAPPPAVAGPSPAPPPVPPPAPPADLAPQRVPDPQPDAEHTLADWARIDGGPVPEPEPAPPRSEPAAAAALPSVAFPVPLVLSLVVVAGVLQLLSRFVVFEGTTGYKATDFGLPNPPWLLAVGLPLLVASQLLIMRSSRRWALALSAGLVTGAALSQVDLVLATGAYFLNEGISDVPAQGWWAVALSTVALVACVVVILLGAGFRERPRLRRDWRAVVATAVVLGALIARLNAFSAAWPWFPQNEPALLLAAACLPLTLLALNGAQRLLGLTALTIFGLWVCAAHVYAIVNQSFPVDEPASVLALVSALASVSACYLAQVWVGRRSGEPTAGTALRR